MSLSLVSPLWKEAPFLRLLIPFAAGIFLQQNVDIDRDLVVITLAVLACSAYFLHARRLYFKFKYNWVTGIFIHLLLVGIGYLICETADGTNRKNSIVSLYSPGDMVQLTLDEPLIEKVKSFKATASIQFISTGNSLKQATGKVNIYFSKDLDVTSLNYGSCILVAKSLQPITNSGNPGAFDYKLYCERQGIYYSVFLTSRDFHLIPGKREQKLKKFLFATRDKVLEILSEYIPKGKELGLAKALLIGYKDELDKNLVQSYSNTGVVHIIAISGLHLGIIYWLLSLVLSPIQQAIRTKWLTTLFMLVGLWLFSLLAGAGPSVMRSAFMFSMIALGNCLSKNSNVFNNLAFSAFALLCYNPYWLWDAGFQLSYAAVLSIVIFFKPIYNWLYFPNKIVDFAWKLIAVTLGAQILTLPISIYHFHQLPVYFILSNLVAVPLSSVILITEVLICCFAFLTPVAAALGNITSMMIELLNTYIENINQLPFAVWTNLQISWLQMVLFFFLIGGIACWVMINVKTGLWTALLSLLFLIVIRATSFLAKNEQSKLIVYNLPNGSAIDFINGRKYSSICSDEVLADPLFGQLNLQASRSFNRVAEQPNLDGLMKNETFVSFCGKTILLFNDSTPLPTDHTPIDILILSKSPGIRLSSLINKFSPKQIVADASNQSYKVIQWQNEAKYYQIPFHNVRLQGAYVNNLR